MSNAVQILRSNVAGKRPAGRAPGEMYINFADKKVGYIDEAGQPHDIDTGGGGAVFIGPKPPPNPTEGQLFYENVKLNKLFIYTNNSWFDATPIAEGVAASTGVPDAGKAVLLDAEGKIDDSMLPAETAASAGATDAGKLVALDAAGKIDDSMLPAFPASVDETTGATDAGKLVALDTTGKIDASMLPAAAATGPDHFISKNLPTATDGKDGDIWFKTV